MEPVTMCQGLTIPIRHNPEGNFEGHLLKRRKHLSVSHRRWTKQEVHFLWQRVGIDTVRVMARRLGRSERAVRWRLGSLGISAKIKDSWSQRELQRMLHVGSGRLQRWIKSGALKMRHARAGEHALRAFVRQHANQLNWILIHPELRQWFIEECQLTSVAVSHAIVQPILKHALVSHNCPACDRRTHGNAYFRHQRCCPWRRGYLAKQSESLMEAV